MTAIKAFVRWILAASLVFTGLAHFVVADRFLPLVPSWIPWPEAVVAVTGVMEVVLAVALVLAPAGSRRRATGWALAAFLTVVVAGNVTQALSGADAFGLDTDAERWTRLAFQPLLIGLALWSTEALRAPAHRAGGGGNAHPGPSRV
ncbi:MAG TPA: hypothetical protein VNC60_02655 [Actinomycetota bacterium]|nr:hypothetical protein [Actinomycetota bacterium]